MAKSFFERLTGSVRVADELGEPPAEMEIETAAASSVRRRRKSGPPSLTDTYADHVLHPTGTREETSAESPIMPEEPPEEGQLTVDIWDDGVNIVIQSTVAGVKPEDIDISLEDNVLTIRGARRRTQEVEEANFYYRELYWGAFSRSIILPEEVDFQKAEAAMKHGLLSVKLPKKDKGAKKLKVRLE